MHETGAETNIDREWLPTRQSLLSRLKDSENDASWRRFFDTYWKLIYNAARRSGLADSEAQDVVQETIISVMKAMPKFQYEPERGSFKSWLLQITKWRIGDHNRKRGRERKLVLDSPERVCNSDETATIERVPDPNGAGFEAIWDEEWQANILEVALGRLKKNIDLKQFQIFDLYVLKGWNATDVAAALKVNIGFVYLTKHRVQRLMKREMAELQLERI